VQPMHCQVSSPQGVQKCKPCPSPYVHLTFPITYFILDF
jgi:hypothetical protein